MEYFSICFSKIWRFFFQFMFSTHAGRLVTSTKSLSSSEMTCFARIFETHFSIWNVSLFHTCWNNSMRFIDKRMYLSIHSASILLSSINTSETENRLEEKTFPKNFPLKISPMNSQQIQYLLWRYQWSRQLNTNAMQTIGEFRI